MVQEEREADKTQSLSCNAPSSVIRLLPRTLHPISHLSTKQSLTHSLDRAKVMTLRGSMGLHPRTNLFVIPI